MAKKQKSSAPDDETVAAILPHKAGDGIAVSPDAPNEAVADRFIGQWNRLVSTTNWEKGRIICQWREALELAGAAVTEYSDEAWAQLVGGVTSQHVGRLRRVFQKFGPVFGQYDGLFWSHFQAGLDWDDAEMWLEGAILNNWSVSQMRGKRWEALGNPGAPPTDEQEPPFDEDATAPNKGEAASAAGSATQDAASKKSTRATDDEDSTNESAESNDDSETADGNFQAPATSPAKSRTRLAVDVDELPDDLADAFEQFKLAIIAQRRLSWSETTPEAVIECLDALKALALAPSDD